MGGNSFTLFVSPHLWWGGGTPARSNQLGGVTLMGVPPAWGYPTSGTPTPIVPGWGYPPGGYPLWVPPPPIGPGWGVPHLGTLPLDLVGGTPQGVPHLGYPCQTWLGGTPPQVPSNAIVPGWGVPPAGGTPPRVPPIRPGWGYPLLGGYPTSGTPHQTWLGGTPCRGGTPLRETDGVLDTPRSVCLLRSRRRTFLFFVCLHFCLAIHDFRVPERCADCLGYLKTMYHRPKLEICYQWTPVVFGFSHGVRYRMGSQMVYHHWHNDKPWR